MINHQGNRIWCIGGVKMELSKNELAVMEVIWKSDKGATVNAISEVVNEISMPTLHRVVSDLLEKMQLKCPV